MKCERRGAIRLGDPESAGREAPSRLRGGDMLSRLARIVGVVCVLSGCAPFLSAQALIVNKYVFSGDTTPIGGGNSALQNAEACINTNYTNVTPCAANELTETAIGAPVLYVITISTNNPTAVTNASVYETLPPNFVADPTLTCFGFGLALCPGSTLTATLTIGIGGVIGPFTTIPQNGDIVLDITGHFNLSVAPPFTETNFVSAEPTDTLAQCMTAVQTGARHDCSWAPLQVPGYSLLTDLSITKIVCIQIKNFCTPNVTNTIAAPGTATGAGPVNYVLTITNNGPAVIYPDVLQVADTVYNIGSSFTVNYAITGVSCSPGTCTLGAISGTLPPSNNSSPQTVAAKFSATPLPVGSSITVTYTATFTYLACTAGEVENVASLGYSDGTGTISDTNNSNNTSNDAPTALPAYVTLPPDVTTCPPVLSVLKTVSPASSFGSGSLPWSTLWTYTITLTSTGPLPATTLTDYVYKTVPTPVFTPVINGLITCSPASACTPSPITPPPAPTVSTSSSYSLFTANINAITSSTGGTVVLTYSVQYRPQCETNAGQDWITNEADWNVSGIDYEGFANAFLVENTACPLAACKVNYDDTANPNPAVDCAKPATPTLLNFPGTQTFTAFYQNLGTSSTPVGTILDALSVSSQTYGAFPINYTYSCNFLSPFTNTLGTPYQNAGYPTPITAPLQWNDPQWAGLAAIYLQNKILPANSTLMCKVTVTTLGAASPNLPTLCQGTGVPAVTNSVLMDLSTGANYNNTGDTPPGPPGPFGQASLILPLCQNFTVVKKGDTSVGAGQQASFTITASNNESNDVNGFTVTDPLPAGFSFAGPYGTHQVPPVGTASCAPLPCYLTTSKTGVSATYTTIPKGGSGTLTLTATAPSAGGSFDNTATGSFAPIPVSCVLPSCDPYTYSGGGGLVGVLNGQVLAPKVTKAFGPPSAGISTLTFTITNVNGNPLQSGMGFTDTLPAGLYYTGSFSSTCGGTGTFLSGTQPNAFTFSNGVLNSGTSTCTITVQVEAISCGTFSNSASNIANVNNLDATGVSATLTVPCDAFIEVCKASSSINPVTGNFTFTSPAFTGFTGNSITVPAGSCSGPISVYHGSVTITETPVSGVSLSGVVASGYAGSVLTNRLVTSNLTAGTATVTTVAGNVSSETVATFTNQGTGGNLKICKIAGGGVAVGTNYTFTATSTANGVTTSQTYTVPAGPAPEGGYCIIDSTAFAVGSTVTVAETLSPLFPYNVTSVVSPAGTTGGSSIKATLGSGFTEVTFTNSRFPFVTGATSINFTAVAFQLPGPQTVTVTSTPSVPFTAVASISSGPAGWLTVSPPQGQTPGTLTVAVTALPAGTYNGAITITSTDPNNPFGSTIPVTLTVANAATTYYFPHLAVGGGFQTTLTYVNYSPQAVSCQTTFYSDSGAALPVPFAGGSVSTRTDNLGAGGDIHVQTTAGATDALLSGWAQAQCTGPVKASLLYRAYTGSVPQGEASVPASTSPATEFVTFAQTLTGVAYANPSSVPAAVTIAALDSTGAALGQTTLTLQPNAHGAANVGPLLGLSSFTGSVQITSTAPIVSLSLNAEDYPVFSSLPPGDLPAGTPLATGTAGGTPSSGANLYYFPHLAVGGGFQTTLTYVNYSPQPVSCQTTFYSDSGAALPVPFAGGSVSTRTDNLGAGADIHVQTTAIAAAALLSGWAQAQCTGPVKASLLYRAYTGSVPQGEASVPASTSPATEFVTFAQTLTGVAYANPSSVPATVTIAALDSTGAALGQATLTLQPNAHGAANVGPLLGLSSFTGSVQITSSAPTVSLSLNAEDFPVFSSLPPGDLPAGTPLATGTVAAVPSAISRQK